MPNYELLEPLQSRPDNIFLRKSYLPELVHLDDPAICVMRDFNQNRPNITNEHVSMDEALNEMKMTGCHLLLVTNDDNNLLGLISTEDLLGEKPIKLMNHNRIDRSHIKVKMIMTPISEIELICYESIQRARVGNVVATMKKNNSHYAFIIENHDGESHPTIRGLFNTTQISKQLHSEVAANIAQAQGVSELGKRL